jgi:hypothetical protein
MSIFTMVDPPDAEFCDYRVQRANAHAIGLLHRRRVWRVALEQRGDSGADIVAIERARLLLLADGERVDHDLRASDRLETRDVRLHRLEAVDLGDAIGMLRKQRARPVADIGADIEHHGIARQQRRYRTDLVRQRRVDAFGLQCPREQLDGFDGPRGVHPLDDARQERCRRPPRRGEIGPG